MVTEHNLELFSDCKPIPERISTKITNQQKRVTQIPNIKLENVREVTR